MTSKLDALPASHVSRITFCIDLEHLLEEGLPKVSADVLERVNKVNCAHPFPLSYSSSIGPIGQNTDGNSEVPGGFPGDTVN